MTARALKPGRIRCAVIGCRRTAPAEKHRPGASICCGKCWRAGPAEHRTAHRRAERFLRPYAAMTEATIEALPEETLEEIHAAEIQASIAFWAVVRAAGEARAGIA